MTSENFTTPDTGSTLAPPEPSGQETAPDRDKSLAAEDANCGEQRKRQWLKMLGPGLITGASDDDPSGIATYSQAGAMFAYGMLWTALFSWPFMAATQEISARIGRVTGRGIAGNIRRVYSGWLLFPIVVLLIGANMINLAADIAAMGSAASMLVGRGSAQLYSILFALLSLGLQVMVRYGNYTRYLKWLALALCVYVATAFFGHVHWMSVLKGSLIPHVQLSGKFISMFIAVIGTTISPYLFFWQASLETEEMKAAPGENRLKKAHGQARGQFERIRFDTYVGMAVSNLIAFFIMLTMAVTVGSSTSANHEINTAQDAAIALGEALGLGSHGRLAFWLFGVGVIGTGLLAVPVLAGSAAYAVGEAMHWRASLDRKFDRAKGFYIVICIATLLGVGINFIHGFDPVKALVWAALINGIVSVPVMIVMMLMVSNPKVMGHFAYVGKGLRIMGWIATGIMTLATIGLFVVGDG